MKPVPALLEERDGSNSKGKGKGKPTDIAATGTATPAKSEASAAGTKKRSMREQINSLAGVGLGSSERPQKNVRSVPARSAKAPSRKAPTANNKASAPDINAPLDMVPAAQRASPLKQDPTNIAIHGHQSSRGRRTQAKRDGR